MKYFGLIEYQYLFSTFGEYKKKRRLIMDAYVKWNKQQIAIYRMYVFSRPILKEKQKEWIWQEINEFSSRFYNRMEIEDEGSD